jgi:1-deoxy-D-xylulose-5-phosphate synthase
VADARFAKPLDRDLIRVLEHLASAGLLDGSFAIRTLTLPDRFEPHASPALMYERSGLTAPHLADTAVSSLECNPAHGGRRRTKLVAIT